MIKLYLIGGAIFIGALLSIEIMNVIDASKIQKLNDQMSARFHEKIQKEADVKMTQFCQSVPIGASYDEMCKEFR